MYSTDKVMHININDLEQAIRTMSEVELMKLRKHMSVCVCVSVWTEVLRLNSSIFKPVELCVRSNVIGKYSYVILTSRVAATSIKSAS